MSELKTKANDADVRAFIERIEDPVQRADAEALVALMRRATGAEPRMWGTSIVGFGTYHYEYESGRQGEWFLAGFSPRKRNLTLYIMPGFDGYQDLLDRLGKHKTGKSCLYLSTLAAVDREALEQLVTRSVSHLKQKHT